VSRVLLVAPDAATAGRLRVAVEGRPGLEIVGAFAFDEAPTDVRQAFLRAVDTLAPDVVVASADGSAGDAAARLAWEAPTTPPALVLLAERVEGMEGAEALRAGARALLPRDATPAELAAAVEAAAAGLVAVHPDALTALVAAGRAAAADPGGQPLTPRELEVLQLLADGLANKEIAWRLGISDHTAKFHVASICAKLHASGRTEAVAIGIRQGLIMV
jgi:DNA-binding NarL/FixJ family response regulator